MKPFGSTRDAFPVDKQAEMAEVLPSHFNKIGFVGILSLLPFFLSKYLSSKSASYKSIGNSHCYKNTT